MVDWNSKSDAARKIVVITSRLLSDAHRYILRCLSTHQAVRHCTIFTSISEVLISAFLAAVYSFYLFFSFIISSLVNVFLYVGYNFHFAQKIINLSLII